MATSKTVERLKKPPVLHPETREEYFAKLDTSIRNIEAGEIVEFTPEQFEKMVEFVEQKPSKAQLVEFLQSIGVDTAYVRAEEI